MGSPADSRCVAFVLGGGGALGACEVAWLDEWWARLDAWIAEQAVE